MREMSSRAEGYSRKAKLLDRAAQSTLHSKHELGLPWLDHARTCKLGELRLLGHWVIAGEHKSPPCDFC